MLEAKLELVEVPAAARQIPEIGQCATDGAAAAALDDGVAGSGGRSLQLDREAAAISADDLEAGRVCFLMQIHRRRGSCRPSLYAPKFKLEIAASLAIE